jgi:hypothetical protein
VLRARKKNKKPPEGGFLRKRRAVYLAALAPAVAGAAAEAAAVAALAELVAAAAAADAALAEASAAAGAGAGAGTTTGAGAGAGAASSFLPQAARATEAIRVARTSDFFIADSSRGDQFPEMPRGQDLVAWLNSWTSFPLLSRKL